jgi:hypothetical protein
VRDLLLRAKHLFVAATTGASPPRNLGQHGRQLWDAVQREYGIADRYSRTGVPRTHPAVKDALACRAFIVKTIERLGLNVEGVKPVGRPTANLGWTGEI